MSNVLFTRVVLRRVNCIMLINGLARFVHTRVDIFVFYFIGIHAVY